MSSVSKLVLLPIPQTCTSNSYLYLLKSQKCWKNKGGIPSGLGAFIGAIYFKPYTTSHSSNLHIKSLFISSEITHGIWYRASSCRVGFKVVKSSGFEVVNVSVTVTK